MNQITVFTLKALRKVYSLSLSGESSFGRNWKMFSDKHYANELIYKKLVADEPCMIARFGSTEMLCLINYLGIKHRTYRNYRTFIRSETPPWWWEKSMMTQMEQWSGFFPATEEKLEQFCQLMLEDIPEVDILGSWLKEEIFFKNELKNSKRVVLEDLEPFFATNPWTKALEGKNVLVVHPFVETIENQFRRRELLFENDLLPTFTLHTLKAVQSIAGAKTEHRDWFEALEFMKSEIDKINFDICIIGAGAYGFPLAAHVKKSGKKAIHLAGATQLLFGIKGKRWEEYIVWPYTNLFNEHWVRPGEQEKPKNAAAVEGACYW